MNDQLTSLASQLADVQERLEALAAQEAQIKAAIREATATTGPDRYSCGDLTVVVATNRRFNERKALPLIPENLIPLVTYPKTCIDKDKLKVLCPDVYEQATDNHDNRVSLA